ncbi:hypothetical protein Tco_1207147, partial [Tanacetum coccineum]
GEVKTMVWESLANSVPEVICLFAPLDLKGLTGLGLKGYGLTGLLKGLWVMVLGLFVGPDDDEIPTKQVSQDIMQEVSLTIDEAKLKKMADEMLRQRCTSGDEHQYRIDQMKNFWKSNIVWESRKEILVSLHP